jgi:hypothetical protein
MCTSSNDWWGNNGCDMFRDLRWVLSQKQSFRGVDGRKHAGFDCMQNHRQKYDMQKTPTIRPGVF